MAGWLQGMAPSRHPCRHTVSSAFSSSSMTARCTDSVTHSTAAMPKYAATAAARASRTPTPAQPLLLAVHCEHLQQLSSANQLLKCARPRVRRVRTGCHAVLRLLCHLKLCRTRTACQQRYKAPVALKVGQALSV